MRISLALAALVLAGSSRGARADDGAPEHRAGDERLFLIPTAQTMPAGSLSVSDDELVLLRAAAGVTSNLQLDLRLGALPIPAAAGGAIPFPGGIVAGGGAGLALLGIADIGVKYRLVPESGHVPGIAIGYDLVDAFAGAVGGAGIAFAGGGSAGTAALVGVGGANLQFNLFSVAFSAHAGRRFQFVAGAYVLDNHHFLPQSTKFATACGAGGTGSPGDGGKVEQCSSGGSTIDRFPTQFQPFFGAEVRVGKQSSFAGDVLVGQQLRDTVGTTGFRWIIGDGRLKARLDLALLWSHIGTPLPWIGAGVHFD